MTSYDTINFPEPSIFENTRAGAKTLIIGSGNSTKEIAPFKKDFKKYFDIVIACNHSFKDFDDIIDFHIVTEKTSIGSGNTVHKTLERGNFNIDVPRIVNWKGIDLYPKKYKYIKTTRSGFGGHPNIKKYENGKDKGLLIGPIGKQKFSLGSVVLSAMHFGSIIGSSKIFLVGADMCFKNEFDHYYEDKFYRERPKELKKENAHKIIKVCIGEKSYDTTEFFKESADYISDLINTLFGDIRIYDFSDGLIKNVNRLNIRDFFKNN